MPYRTRVQTQTDAHFVQIQSRLPRGRCEGMKFESYVVFSTVRIASQIDLIEIHIRPSTSTIANAFFQPFLRARWVLQPTVALEKGPRNCKQRTKQLFHNGICTSQVCNFSGRLVYVPRESIHFDVTNIERVVPRVYVHKNFA